MCNKRYLFDDGEWEEKKITFNRFEPAGIQTNMNSMGEQNKNGRIMIHETDRPIIFYVFWITQKNIWIIFGLRFLDIVYLVVYEAIMNKNV